MGVPVGLVGKGLVDAVVKVLVVREDDMAADIVELDGAKVSDGIMHKILPTHEALWGDIGRGETSRGLIGVDNHP